MARLAYWNGTASNFEITSASNISMRGIGVTPTSDFYTKFCAFPRRATTDIGTVIYDPLNVAGSVTKTEMWGRFWFQPLTAPASDARIYTSNWIGGAGHDTIRIAFTSSRTLTFSVWNGSSHVAVFTSSALTLGTYYRIEFHWKFVAAGTTTFTSDAKIDGVSLGATNSQNYSGVTIGSNSSVIGEASGIACKYNISEYGIDSADWLGNTRTTEIPLTGVGTYDAWTVDANRTYLEMSDYPYADNSGSFGYAATGSGLKVTWTTLSLTTMGITGAIKSMRVHWFKNNGNAMQVLVRRNGADTTYTPAGLTANYDSVLIDTAGWLYTDTIEVGFVTTSAVTQRVAYCGVYIEHDTADPGAPTGNMKVLSGTYSGTGHGQEVLFGDSDVTNQNPDFIAFLRTDLAQTTTWWWDTKNATRKDLNGDSSYTFINPIKGGFRINNGQASVNTNGGTYSYVAFFDPTNRGSERGGWAALTTDDNTDVSLRNSSFIIEAMIAEHEANNSTLKANTYLRAPGMTGDQSDAVNLTTVSFKADGIQSIGTGTFQVGTTLNYTQPGSSYVAFRTTQFGSKKIFDTDTFTGNGGGARTITVDLGGLTPCFILLATNQNIGRLHWQGGVCKSISTGGITATGITGVGVNSFTVHSTYNTNAAIYSYLIFANGLDLDPGTFGVTLVTPPSGPIVGGGAAVNVTGVGFESAGSFSFGGSAPTSVNVTSSTTATMVVPAHAAGVAVVTYSSPLGVVGSLTSTYTYLNPTITTIVPDHGPVAGGTFFTITGTVFEVGVVVTFDGLPATGVIRVSDTTITGYTPAHVVALVDVVVTNPDTTSVTAQGGFQYIADPTTAGQWRMFRFDMRPAAEATQ